MDNRLEYLSLIMSELEAAGRAEVKAKRKANRRTARRAKMSRFLTRFFEAMAYADPTGLAWLYVDGPASPEKND